MIRETISWVPSDMAVPERDQYAWTLAPNYAACFPNLFDGASAPHVYRGEIKVWLLRTFDAAIDLPFERVLETSWHRVEVRPMRTRHRAARRSPGGVWHEASA